MSDDLHTPIVLDLESPERQVQPKGKKTPSLLVSGLCLLVGAGLGFSLAVGGSKSKRAELEGAHQEQTDLLIQEKKGLGEQIIILQESLEGAQAQQKTLESEAEEKLASAKRVAKRLKEQAELSRVKLNKEWDHSRQSQLRLIEWVMSSQGGGMPSLKTHPELIKEWKTSLSEVVKSLPADAIPQVRARLKMTQLELDLAPLAEGDTFQEGYLNQLNDVLGLVGEEVPQDLSLRVLRAYAQLVFLKTKEPEQTNTVLEQAEAWAKTRVTEKTDEVKRLKAAIQYGKGKHLRSIGEKEQSLAVLNESIEQLAALVKKYPDHIPFKRAIAKAASDAGQGIVYGEGALTLTQLRTKAARLWLEVVSNDPKDPESRLQMGLSYAEVANLLQETGEIRKAEKVATQALSVLTPYQKRFPKEARASLAVAAQKGVIALSQWDRSATKKSEESLTQALEMVEGVLKEQPGLVEAQYRRAMLLWQFSEVFDGLANPEKSGEVLVQAQQQLSAILTNANSSLETEKISRSFAYLSADVGDSYELKGKKEASQKAFKNSLMQWEKLLESDPKSLEYQEGYDWVLSRIKQ